MSKKNDKGARATSPLWPQQRTICASQGFPTWGSPGHLAEGLYNRVTGATLGQWGFPT